MGRLAVAVALLAAVAAVPQAARLPVALFGCVAASLAYRGRMLPVLLRFFLIWLLFYGAVAAGRAWAGTSWVTLVLDGAGSLGLALGVAGAVLLVVTAAPALLLESLDRMRAPREFSYAVLALIGLLPHVRSAGSRQLALLRLKGSAGGGIGRRLRAYPRIVAPLFGQLMLRQWTHARSLAVRGFFERPGPAAEAAPPVVARDLALIAALALAAAIGLGAALWLKAGTWS